MTLSPGARLGPYEIVSAIGAGGMGEVFRARDTKLNRDVAIKVLPAAFADDPERLARFTREAQTLASLNHPNIATIHGIEEIASADPQVERLAMTGGTSPDGLLAVTKGAGASRALVMELVEGEDLSTHLARGPIPTAEALPIARQIAEALEAAHEQGIVHRDLKPANIKVRTDGTVKVLDFGLAKAMDGGSATNSALSQSPTMSRHMTEAGMIIGTAAYMSPEQAKGKPVDKRTDIWAFGVVLYEMLTGRRAFKGEDVSETLASVLKDTLSMDALPATTPPRLKRLIERCLDRDLRNRLRDIGDARVEISQIAAGATDGSSAAPPAVPSRFGLVSVGLVLLGAVAGALGARWGFSSGASSGGGSDTQPVLSEISAAPGLVAAFAHGFALSPDEKTLVYSGRRADGVRLLFKRRLDTVQAEPLANTDGAMYPFWSPDSRQVGFWADFKLRSISIEGGPARTIVATIDRFSKGSWSTRDEILFADGRVDASLSERRIYRVPASGGQPEEVALDGGGNDPTWMADGRRFLFRRAGTLYAASIEGKSAPIKIRDLQTEGGGAGTRLGSGFLAFNQASLLSFQRFDETTLALRGPVMPIANKAGGSLGWFTASAAGRKVIALPGDPTSTLRWVDRDGRDAGTLAQPEQYWNSRLSHDGQRALVNQQGGSFAIDRRTGLKTRVRSDARPGIWSADDRDVIVWGIDGVWIQSASGEGEPRQVMAFKERLLRPLDASLDGRTILVRAEPAPGTPSVDLLIMKLADGTTTPFATTRYDEEQGSFSPDGRFIAYVDNSTGRQEVYARRIDGTTPPVRLSVDGGLHPLWRRDGQELFYLSPLDDVVAVDTGVLLRGGLPGKPRTLFRTLLNDIASYANPPYAVAPDGRLFLINAPARPDPLTLIQLPPRFR